MLIKSAFRFSITSCIALQSISCIKSVLYQGKERSKLVFVGKYMRVEPPLEYQTLVYYYQGTSQFLDKSIV